MYKGYKIVAFIPAGRAQTMDILFKHLMRHSDIIDEVMLWKNTEVESDIKFIEEAANNPLFKVYGLPKQYKFISQPIQYNTGRFYHYTTDPNTIYIRFDDDIIYIDDEYLPNLLDFRLEYPDYFLVFGHIVNNAMCAYLEQKAGVFASDIFEIDNGYCMNRKTWGNPRFAEFIHELLLEKIDEEAVKDFYFESVELDSERFSISNFCFFGSDFAEFNGHIQNRDEEIWLTEEYPKASGKLNAICGDAVVSHYTFSPYQKPHIQTTDILERYSQLADRLLSRDYYKLLNVKYE